MEGLELPAVPWRSFGLALLVFAFLPGVVLRVLVLLYPAEHSRRRELLGQLYALPQWQRPWFVVQQLETALFEGLPVRACVAWRRVWAMIGRAWAGAVVGAARRYMPEGSRFFVAFVIAGFALAGATLATSADDSPVVGLATSVTSLGSMLGMFVLTLRDVRHVRRSLRESRVRAFAEAEAELEAVMTSVADSSLGVALAEDGAPAPPAGQADAPAKPAP